MWTWLTRIAALGMCIGIILAAATYAVRPTSASNGDWYHIENQDRDLGALPFGKHEVVFQVANVSDQPRRIVGAGNECYRNVCYKFKLDDPITIPPGKTADIPCELTVSGEGPIEVSMLLYLEDDGIRQTPLTIRGVGVPAEGNPELQDKLQVPSK